MNQSFCLEAFWPLLRLSLRGRWFARHLFRWKKDQVHFGKSI